MATDFEMQPCLDTANTGKKCQEICAFSWDKKIQQISTRC